VDEGWAGGGHDSKPALRDRVNDPGAKDRRRTNRPYQLIPSRQEFFGKSICKGGEPPKQGRSDRLRPPQITPNRARCQSTAKPRQRIGNQGRACSPQRAHFPPDGVAGKREVKEPPLRGSGSEKQGRACSPQRAHFPPNGVARKREAKEPPLRGSVRKTKVGRARRSAPTSRRTALMGREKQKSRPSAAAIRKTKVGRARRSAPTSRRTALRGREKAIAAREAPIQIWLSPVRLSPDKVGRPGGPYPG